MFSGLQRVILFKGIFFFLLPIQRQVVSFEMLPSISLAIPARHKAFPGSESHLQMS